MDVSGLLVPGCYYVYFFLSLLLLRQRSPTFLAPQTGFVEESEEQGGGSQEADLKQALHLGPFLTGRRPVDRCWFTAHGLGTPVLNHAWFPLGRFRAFSFP